MWAYEFKKFLPRKVHTMTWLTGANVDCDHCRVGTAWYRAWCRHYDATHRDAGPSHSRGWKATCPATQYALYAWATSQY